MELFKFIHVLFLEPDLYQTISNDIKAKHYYMLNRFMSIQYPGIADALNINHINPIAVVDYWHRTMSKLYKHKIPNWMYTKTTTKKNDDGKIYVPTEMAISMFCSEYELGTHDFDAAKIVLGDALDDVLKEFENDD